jgi:hypothetical protein
VTAIGEIYKEKDHRFERFAMIVGETEEMWRMQTVVQDRNLQWLPKHKLTSLVRKERLRPVFWTLCPRDRCSTALGYHVMPHRGCILR